MSLDEVIDEVIRRACKTSKEKTQGNMEYPRSEHINERKPERQGIEK